MRFMNDRVARSWRRDYSQGALQSIGLVLQEPFLIMGTIASNNWSYHEEPTDEETGKQPHLWM